MDGRCVSTPCRFPPEPVFELGSYEYFEDENLALLRHSPRGSRVLDVGCGFGLLGERLREQGNSVWGIDAADDVAERATERLDRFVLADLTDQTGVAEQIGDQRFDVVVFADVLEHLPDPIGTLRSYLPFLAPGGSLLVSVPNVAVWNVRLGLLFGRFEYTPTGTLDRTHLRFFTRASLGRALGAAGLQVDSIDVNPGIARALVGRAKKMVTVDGKTNPRALLDSRSYRIYRRFIHPIEYRLARLLPGLLAFQYVAVAHPEEAQK
jgi:2-polyprenyl-3-methyl-5-hydroxy-6-metoxy-1,4-benzoquinol methylase